MGRRDKHSVLFERWGGISISEAPSVATFAESGILHSELVFASPAESPPAHSAGSLNHRDQSQPTPLAADSHWEEAVFAQEEVAV